MVKVEVDFQPQNFERHVVNQTKDDIAQRLQGYDLGHVRIVLKREPGHRICLQFRGDREGVEKAKGLLGMY